MRNNGVYASAKDAQELLEEFRLTGSQAPFEEIARRYAGMVFNVAVQVTKDAHDAEDATQATFLTLAVHAKTDSSIRFLGPWLRKVSHRLALDIRRSKKRRKAREEKHANGDDRLLNGYNVPVSKDLQHEELRTILRDELEKLPAKYRMPLVLYYFGGLTPEEMGKELKVNTSTLGVRLHRGRKLLADSLSLRGISLNTAALSVLLAGLVDQFAQQHLVRISTSAAFHAGAIAAYSGPAPAQVASLLAVARQAVSFARLKVVVSVAILVASTIAGGAELLQKFNLVHLDFLNRISLTDWLRPMFDRLKLPSPVSQVLPMQNVEPPRRADATVSLQSFSLANAGVAVALPEEKDRQVLAGEGLFGFAVQPARSATAVSARPIADNSTKLAAVSPNKFFSLQSASKASRPRSTRLASSASDDADLIVDSSAGSASISFASGLLKTARLIVGDGADGEFTQSGGEVRAAEGVTVGRLAGSTGRYNLNAGTLATAALSVGESGRGVFNQTGGSVGGLPGTNMMKTLSLGTQASGVGEYNLSAGTLSAVRIVIGDAGAGTLTQNGGTVTLSAAYLGNAASGSGTWSISGGSIRLASASGETSGIVVGNDGLGSLLVRPKANGVSIAETSTNVHAGLTIRATSGADGILRGWGDIGLTGTVVQNGRVVADGNGVHHLLDLSSVANIANTIDNVADGGSNGWYARGGGSLKLPAVSLTNDSASTWGEDAGDPTIDLVNSIRLTPHGLSAAAPLSITLLDAQNSDAPRLPIDGRALTIYQVDSPASATSIDWTFRVDDVQAALLAMNESDLTIWSYKNGWHALAAGSLEHDLTDHLLSGTIGGLPSYLAVGEATTITFGAAPEPASLVLMGAAIGGACLARRRRRG